MISIKHVVAAVVLGAAFLMMPTTASAKVLHPTKTHALKSHAKKLHRTHGKHTAMHAGRVKGKALSHKKSKATGMSSSAGWKHHRSI